MGKRLDDLRFFKESCDQGTWKIFKEFPEDQLDYRPFEGMMTFAEQIHHLALAERLVMSQVAKSIGLEQKFSDVQSASDLNGQMQELQKTWLISGQVLNQMKDDDLDRDVVFPERNIKSSAGKLVAAMIEHSVHHRGEIIVYFRALGKEPPRRWSD